MNEPTPVKVGDTIVVNGHLFVLTSVEVRLDLPAIVTFKQPVELVNAGILNIPKGLQYDPDFLKKGCIWTTGSHPAPPSSHEGSQYPEDPFPGLDN